jgi:hypothetical protein
MYESIIIELGYENYALMNRIIRSGGSMLCTLKHLALGMNYVGP